MELKEYYWTYDTEVEPGWILNEEENKFSSKAAGLYSTANKDYSHIVFDFHTLHKLAADGENFVWLDGFKNSKSKNNFIFKIVCKYHKTLNESEPLANNEVYQVDYEENLWFLVCSDDESKRTENEVRAFFTTSSISEFEISRDVLDKFHSCAIYNSRRDSKSYQKLIHGLKELNRQRSELKSKNNRPVKMMVVKIIDSTSNEEEKLGSCIEKQDQYINPPTDNYTTYAQSLSPNKPTTRVHGKPTGNLFRLTKLSAEKSASVAKDDKKSPMPFHEQIECNFQLKKSKVNRISQCDRNFNYSNGDDGFCQGLMCNDYDLSTNAECLSGKNEAKASSNCIDEMLSVNVFEKNNERVYSNNNNEHKAKKLDGTSHEKATFSSKLSTTMNNNGLKCASENELYKNKNIYVHDPKERVLSIIEDSVSYRHIVYGNVNLKEKPRVILFLGATGSGKTTLVNFISNYYFGTKNAEGDKFFVDSSKGKTNRITLYSFHSTDETKYPVTIIDTPGLNDSTGAEIHDHVDALKSFLASACSQGLEIHAIGFVVQAHLVRLTSSERLVMDHVKSLFGSDINYHLITLVTFSDNQTFPPVIEAMEAYNIKVNLFLKFNNTLLSDNQEVDELDRIYWKKGLKSWKKCLKYMQEMEPVSQKTIDLVSKEVFDRSIVKRRVSNLTSEIVKYFKIVETKFLSKDISTDANKRQRKIVWDLLNAVFCLQDEGFSNKEQLLLNFCKGHIGKLDIFHVNQVLFLLLDNESSFRHSLLAVITSVKCIHLSCFQFTKNYDTQICRTSLVLHCFECEKSCFLKRETSKGRKNCTDDYLHFRCSCMHSGSLHGQEKGNEVTEMIEFTNVLRKSAVGSLNRIIESASFPNSKSTIANIFAFLLCEQTTLSQMDMQNICNFILNV